MRSDNGGGGSFGRFLELETTSFWGGVREGEGESAAAAAAAAGGEDTKSFWGRLEGKVKKRWRLG